MQIRKQGWLPVCLTVTFLCAGSCSDSIIGTNTDYPQLVGTGSGQHSGAVTRSKSTINNPSSISLQQESIKRLGIVEFSTRTVLYKDSPMVSTQASGYFIGYAEPLGPLALSELEEAYNPYRSDCGISVEDWTNKNVDLFPEGKYISVGEVLNITAPEGSWPELIENEGLPGFYEMGEDQWLTKPVPSGTILDIPGGDFEPFWVVLDGISPMHGVSLDSDAEDDLTQSSGVRWTKGPDPDSTIVVTLDYTSEDLSKEVYVRCVTYDSGSYTFPAEVKAVIAQYGMQSTDLVVSRHTWEYLISGDALLIVTNTAKSIKW